MLPARTSYGFDVVRALGPTTARVTTGHAATTVSVVKTAAAALAHGGRELGEVTVACVGLGSIGRSSLELLIARAGSPRRLLLCDVASRARHLTEMAAELAVGGGQAVDVCYSEASLPVDVYEADLVVAATSSDGWILDVDRLQPGTIVVDDSFPHCFDTAAAIRRMQSEGDVLVVGGGLLSCGPSEQAPAADLVLPTGAEQALRIRLPDTIASCQIESLLHVGRPDLPLVHGLVDLPHSLAYWEALSDVSAAPLHLLHHVVSPESLMLFAEHSRRARASAAAPVTFDPVAGSSVAVSSTTGASAMRGECQPG
jgi:hypothetical protein